MSGTAAERPRAPDGRLPIEAYAAIGDGRTAALVGLDGTIDWLCLPAYDSPPVFAALLDARRGGRFALAPDEPSRSERRYVDGTCMLETDFASAGGRVRVTDAMALAAGDGAQPPGVVVRRAEGLAGRVRMRWSVEPRFGDGADPPARTEGPVVRGADGRTVAVGAWVRGEACDGTGALGGAVELEAGDELLLALAHGAGAPTAEEAARAIPAAAAGGRAVLRHVQRLPAARIARATALELEDAGFRVVVPQTPLCCGRPLHDYGMLPTARRFLERLIAVLAPYVRRGVHVAGIEPSCVAVLRDELPNMLPQDADARRLALHTLTLAELLTQQAPDGYEPPRLDRRVLVHLHCHHQAVMGRRGEQQLLESMGCDAAFLDTGCCGLAGSFGFEAGEKYEVSMKVAEHRFAPMLRDAPRDALLLGDGFSCRTQAAAVCDRRPLHLAQLLRLARAYGPSGPPGTYPEQACRDAAV